MSCPVWRGRLMLMGWNDRHRRRATTFAGSHDIITIGMLADEVRRARHGARTTFVRVARRRPRAGAPIVIPPAGRRARGSSACRRAATRGDRARARGRWRRPAGAACPASPLRSRALAARDRCTLRALLEDLRAAGLETGRRGADRSAAGSATGDRGSQHRRPRAGAADHPDQLPSADPLPLLKHGRRRCSAPSR